MTARNQLSQNEKTEPRRQFVLVLRETPACDNPIRSLKHILKGALRQHKMRCVSISEVPADTQPKELTHG
jgi:hypothetical protein